MSSKLRSKRPGENFLFDAVTELIATLDLDLQIQWANLAAADSVKTAPEDLVGHYCYQVWHGRQSPCEDCPVQRTIQTGEAHKNEVTSPDGKHWLIRSYPLFSPEGNLESVAELTLEITESKRTEQEMRKSSNLLNKTQEIAQVGSWEVDLVTNCLTWSDEVYRIFGLEPQKSPVTYNDFLELVHPDDRAKVDAAYTNSLKEGKDSYEVDHRIIRADTGEIRYVHEKCFHERDSEGNVSQSVGMVQDITLRKTAEEDLRLNEINLSQTLHSIGDAVISTDRMGCIVRMNPVAESLTGWSFEEAQGKPLTKVFRIVNAFTREPCTDPVQMVLSSGNVQDLANHTVLLAQDGQEYQIADSASPIRDEQGQIIGVVLVFRDVTEKYRQQEVLQESKERLDFALQATNTGLWDWNLQTGEAFFTEQWAAMAGYSLDELRPLSIWTWMDLCHSGDLKHSQALLDKHLKNEIDNYECEARMWHKEGYWIWILDRGKVIEWDESGNPLRMIGTHTDITARKQTEEALQERENRYRVLFEQSPISLWEQDFSGVKYRVQELLTQGVKDLQAYLHANPEEADYLARQVKILDVNQATLDLYQAKSKASFFQGLPEIFEQESLEHFVDSLQHIFSERSSFSDDKIHRTFSGERISVQLFWSKVPGYEESLEKVMVAVVNVTELKQTQKVLLQAKKQAEAANQAKSQFLANMSHEIRTPLNGIMGMHQLLQTADLNQEQSEYLEIAQDASRRLSRLLSDILDLSRIESGKMQLREEKIILNEVKQSIEDIFRHTCQENNNVLQITLEDNVPGMLIGDGTRLTQILFNLAGNALKYTKNGDVSLQISCLSGRRPEMCRLLFIVEDNGPGISEDQVEQIFETFTQANNSESPYARQYEGAGLGLPLVKRLVQLMSGNASICSQTGKGTSAYVSLPFKVPEVLQQHTGGLQEAKKPSGDTTAHVLLVDDEQTTQFYIQRLLEKNGYAVTVAENGEQALAELAENDFDCVLMDVQMPVLDGVEATKKIRSSHHDFKDVPIIALTAYAMSGDRENFLGHGMDDYIAKPVNMYELLKMIDKNISK